MLVSGYGILLVLIYSGMIMDFEKYPDNASCMAKTNRIGEELKVTTWDNMNGSNPIPRVVAAFCVQGSAK